MREQNGYVRLIEHNDWEGETWNFYVPVLGNEDQLNKIDNGIFKYQHGETYKLDRSRLTEEEVDERVSMGGGGYMARHNKYKGIIDEEILDVALQDKDSFFSYLYKGGLGHDKAGLEHA